ncbi:unnamed protein product [Didymodactylos carnosus]|uniref:Uncharacterized protein n=1 Tax=Didymodactylos carnosus TaxID=1234261 RepID=A0A814SJU7_9BILA|nr:unnamed protein product [Didymodactylos carnosus]CAF1148370.1 unnamed protein product [Didymodactylos carnosus]CAF3771323.1 unnamed protein product [Didymodactylos carnosus]CAF3911948.1 unnamed protein product [Didymodactylos carnosus]
MYNHSGNSRATWLEVKNDTDQQIQIKISEVDNSDWDGDSRPDHNFQNAIIEAHQSKKERQELNAHNQTAEFTMTVSQGGNEQFAIRINQWDARIDSLSPIHEKDADCSNNFHVHIIGGLGGGDTLFVTITKK